MAFAIIILLASKLLIIQARPADKNDKQLDGQLIFLQTIWRHGDRTPITVWPNDPNQEQTWKEGLGQLTEKGTQEHFNLGKKLRKMYSGFFSPEYNSNEIYVRSSDVNRTILSAMANMIGFFGGSNSKNYPHGIEGWPIGYHPIPIHTVPEEFDEMRALLQKNCRRFDELSKLMSETPEYLKLLEENYDLLNKMRKITGDHSLSLEKFGLLADTWRIEKHYNRSGTPGFTKEIYDMIEPVAFKMNDMKYGLDQAEFKGVDIRLESARAHGGLLLWSIISRMIQKRDCLETNLLKRSKDDIEHCRWIDHLKYYVLSAHDNTLASLFSTLGFPKTNYKSEGYPPYASCLAIELRKRNQTQEYYVRLNYIVGDDVINVTGDVFGCSGSECKLEQFIDRSSPYKIEDVKQFCETPLIN